MSQALRRERNAVFFTALLIGVLCSAGYNDSFDSTASLEGARALVETGDFAVRPLHPEPLVFHEGRDGAWFSKMGLLPTLLAVPLVLAGSWIARWGIAEKTAVDGLLSFANAFLTAWLLALAYGYFRDRSSKGRAALLTAALGAGTLLLPYAKTCLREPLQGLCLVGAYTAALDVRGPRPLAAGMWAAAALATKAALLIPLLPLLWWVGLSPAAYVGPAIAGLAVLAYQWRAWGSPFYSGYGPGVTSLSAGAWATPWIRGIYQQSLSPDTGLLFVAPLALAPLFARRAWRSARGRTVLAAFLLQALLHAKWYSAVGEETLGPRYLVPVIGVAWLALADSGWRFGKAWIVPISLAVAMQVLFASVKPAEYHLLRHRAGEALRWPHPAANVRFFASKLSGRAERYDLGDFGGTRGIVVDLSDVRSLAGLNYWWSHAARALRGLGEPAPKADSVGGMHDGREQSHAERAKGPSSPSLAGGGDAE